MSELFELPYISQPNEITNEEYHNGAQYEKFISSSELKQMLVSPKWFKYAQDNPSDTRTISLENAMKGSVYHDKLCSIVNTGDDSGFQKTWVVFQPPINPTSGKQFGYDTQKFKDAMAECEYLNPGKEPCSQGDIELSDKMIKELRFGNSHLSADINFLIKHGKAETSHFCEYQGAYFKFRTDLETSTKIVDWKSCQSEVPKIENWSKQVVKMGYDVSASFYQFFCFITTGKWKTFYWVAQEKDAPYDFNIIDASNWAFEITKDADGQQTVIPHSGAQKFIKLMEFYIQCVERDEWPGYSVFTQPDYRGRRIAVVPVPGYEQGKMLNFYL